MTKNRAFILNQILKDNSNLVGRYDNIFIDCPPSLSLLTIMALVSANELLVPLQTEFFALEGITQLVKTIERIKNKFKSLFISKRNFAYHVRQEK